MARKPQLVAGDPPSTQLIMKICTIHSAIHTLCRHVCSRSGFTHAKSHPRTPWPSDNPHREQFDHSTQLDYCSPSQG
ncbi:hypothetical protein RSOLAG1IB_07075 [Rhizoctonia solani AG-1 IB]|uniref:Uncharacterized protein n=1 Tax=Thanatephorus cucumeris (strain AG1-IB / isolate 7/3/14) TaxID=1108050 RepID=A0A0B7FE23_THACB|nr:hypothetical protein RSOLAG1IB_07075 [Rhizoctonia solani AG-1 IB]